MEESIELIVKVKINYPDKSRRQEAIKRAKQCVLSQSVLGNVGVTPKSSKLKSNDVVKKPKIGGSITTLSKLQIQLMSVGISNEDYNDISEMIGNIKEKLANIS
jgi:hypothetical protein